MNRKPSVKRIHVNAALIKSNQQKPVAEREPVFILRKGGRSHQMKSIAICDGGRVVARFVYSPDTPLASGARAWVETSLDVVEE